MRVASAMPSAYARYMIFLNWSKRSEVTAIAQLAPMVVVDVANVMGARADGWWRDRAGAALRLCREVAELAARGVPADRMPAGLPAPAAWVLVLEGQARAAARLLPGAPPAVRVVTAPGAGDDAIVAEVASANGACLVVTADRELRRRCEEAGAAAVGPGWLLSLLSVT
jgi:8-oxo-dGTP diphosphatase